MRNRFDENCMRCGAAAATRKTPLICGKVGRVCAACFEALGGLAGGGGEVVLGDGVARFTKDSHGVFLSRFPEPPLAAFALQKALQEFHEASVFGWSPISEEDKRRFIAANPPNTCSPILQPNRE